MEILRRWRILLPVFIVLLNLAIGLPLSVQSQAGIILPSGFSSSFVAGTFPGATGMTIAPDGRIFILGQYGTVYVVSGGVLLPTPFATFNVNSSGERGLLGVAFDPDFANNNYVYFYYTVNSAPLHNRVVRVTANGNVMQAGSEVLIYQLDNLSVDKNVHNGGAISFRPTDGRNLYIATGDNSTSANSQLLTSSLGKILRITVNTNGTVTIPADNPFNDGAGSNNDAIWALGLRNPFVIAFQPGTGRMFINDVGQNIWEEINDGISGSNYGWPTTEGPTTNPAFRTSLCAYPHPSEMHLISTAPCALTPQTTIAVGCSITGGVFYNPSTQMFPSDFTGDYLFSDYCNDWIKRYDVTTDTVTDFASGVAEDIVDLEVAADGSIYYLVRGNSGGLYRITYSGASNLPPTITQNPTNQTVAEGETASFSCAASGTVPLSYQWQRKNSGAGSFSDIVSATSTTYTTPATVVATENQAQFRCVVDNAHGSATSDPATLTVQANQRPTAVITAPTEETLFSGGQSITFSGTGTDPEDGDIPASGFTWEVEMHHTPPGQQEHIHPTMMPVSGITTGSFTISNDHGDNNHFYRVILTVEDSQGLTHQVTRDIYPQVVTVNIQTQPSGLQVNIDGQPKTAPLNYQWVVNVPRSIGAVTPQTLNNLTYVFQSWSDSGAATHNVTTPTTDTTYTVTYAQQPAITQQPVNASVSEGQTAQFSCLASGTATLAYQWQRKNSAAADFSDISGATSSSYRTRATVVATDHQAQFRCKVTNAYGSATSNAATLTVQVHQINYYTVANPTLTWNSISWAQAYQVQVDDNPGFSSIDKYDNPSIPPGTLSVAPPLDNGVWYWRVRAQRDDQTWGAWSAMQTFTVELP